MKKIKVYIIFLVSMLFILGTIFLGPYIINKVLTWRIGVKGVGITKEIWVGSLGSYIGAIIGGVISGALTLGGVYLTILNERKNRLKEKYPLVKRNADIVLEWVHEIEITLNVLMIKGEIFNDENSEYFVKRFESLETDDENMLETATRVNGYYYITLSKIIMQCKYIKQELEILNVLEDDNKEYANNDILKMSKEIRELIKGLKDNIEKLNKQFIG